MTIVGRLRIGANAAQPVRGPDGLRARWLRWQVFEDTLHMCCTESGDYMFSMGEASWSSWGTSFAVLQRSRGHTGRCIVLDQRGREQMWG